MLLDHERRNRQRGEQRAAHCADDGRSPTSTKCACCWRAVPTSTSCPSAAGRRCYLAARSDGSAPIVRLLMAAAPIRRPSTCSKVDRPACGNDRQRHSRRFAHDRRAGAGRECRRFRGIHAADLCGARTAISHAVRLLLAKGAERQRRSGDGSFQKVKAGTIALGHWTPLTGGRRRSASPELIKTLARRRRRGQRQRCARHDAADAGRRHRSPEYRQSFAC